MRNLLQLAGWLGLLLVSTPTGAATSSGLGFLGVEDLNREHVQARLVFDADRLAPGDSVTVGIVLVMEDHWHTYWAFSGDAGLPTQVEWDLPAGIEAGPLRWPGPTRYTEAGDLTVFGYADEVVLLTTLHAAVGAVLPSPLQVGAHVSWLVCAEICIPGDTTVTATLSADEAGLIDAYRPRVAQPWTADDAEAVMLTTTVSTTAPGRRDVSATLQGARIGAGLPDLFVLDAGEGAYLEAGTRRVVGDRVEVHFSVVAYAGESPPDSVRVVVAYVDGTGKAVYRELSLPLPAQAAGPGLLETDYTTASASQPWWIYMLMALLGGMILNLMPCVLPVISLKIITLVSHAGEAPGRVRQLGLAFSAGVVFTFLLLALIVVAIKATGEQIGWGFQFQSPAFVIALLALVFVLALSLFGVVTFRVPGGGGALGSLADREGLLGSFANGILATILATPCTAPFLGSALGFAFSQPAAVTIGIFTVTGIGMALPYALLAMRPGWVRMIPRPGDWMEHFKQLMGFLLMATALWLLWVLGKQLGMEAVVWTSAFLLCLALAASIVGQWVDLRSSSRHRRWAWLAASTVVLAGYGWLVHPLLTTSVVTVDHADEEWIAFDVAGVEEMIAAGQMIFIDFTAEWCWTCKVNERTVLDTETVRSAFARTGVTLVKADWTHGDTEITKMLTAFGRSGVPLYVIFPAGRPDAPIVLPEVITRSIVVEALRQAEALALAK